MTGYRVAVGFGLVFATFAMALMALPVIEFAGSGSYADAWTRRGRKGAEVATVEVSARDPEAGGTGGWPGPAAGAVGSCFASFVALGLAGASLFDRR